MTTPRSTVRQGIAMVLAPATALASGLMSPPALGAPGDLDPSFGDVGRVHSALNFAGPAWSVEPLDNDASIVAGGDFCDGFYCYYYSDGFIGHLSGVGALDFTIFADILATTEVRDVATQPDGKFIGVGRREGNGPPLAVFRLDPQGQLDPTFGTGGIAQFLPATSPADTGAQSVTLDPDGRIVVAGAAHGQLVVLRLLANGMLDSSFGDAGIFMGPPNDFTTTQTQIVRTAAGAYRVSTNFHDPVSHCRVVGLTAAGALDNAFGTAGIAALDPPAGTSIDCSSMVGQPDGRLLLAGREDGHAYALRLRADGTADPGFAAPAVASTMDDATALAIDSAGAILVAGRASSGNTAALVVRLQASGALDLLYGSAGQSWIDLPSDWGTSPVIHDMAVLADGRVLAAGGDQPLTSSAGPFLVRLLGVGGSDGPGVVGVSQPLVPAMEQIGQAVVTVRRTGGAAGPVSVAYETAPYPFVGWAPATPGLDFTSVTGRLTWQDGDVSDKQIVVPIASGDDSAEARERFVVALSDAQGGAGLATRNAIVEIAADNEPPAGQFNFDVTAVNVAESAGVVTVHVKRDYHAIGMASVTVTPVAGTAGSADFSAAPQTLSWTDGDSAPKDFAITIVNDSDDEGPETLTVQLSDATGGAVIGPQSIATISIVDNDLKSPGGGGVLGLLSLAYLAAMRLLSAWMRSRQPR